ncbi:alpha/beta hydrolase [Lactiplantibacillus plantarum]|uniref:alpha/beta hydrolase n=2 Tax=Lactobacillales TaxID=186826 RepID=UPI00078B3C5E|nr:alpha/beta hydrolase [Lactiplantibacillus plantarum]AMV70368.1 Esterase/lipase [Pediococcus damnosus]
MTIKAITYGKDPLQTADLYVPTTSNGAAVVFVHGGAWLRGDKTDGQNLAEVLAQAGYLVAAINYRLAQAALFPAAQSDLETFITWFKASDYQQLRLGLLGVSVGGTMALTAAFKFHLPVVTWSAVVESANWMATHQNVKPALDAKKTLGLAKPRAIKDAFYRYFIENYLGTVTSDKLQALDPLQATGAELPAVMMFNSTDEIVPLGDALTFLNRLTARQPNSRLTVFSGDGHAQAYEARALGQTLAFFDQQLQG